MTDIGIFEAIYTARSLRRLKPDPVPETLITRILDAAIRAPSAGNAQNWAFIVIREPSVRRALGDIYQKASRIADAMYAARGRPPHLTEQQFRRMMTTGSYLWAHMGDAPVILVPCQRRPVVPPPEALPPELRDRHPAELAYAERIRGASLYPAVQNILLACRALGLGNDDHDQPHPHRGRGQGGARPAGRGRYLRDDADRVADRPVRPADPAPGRRGRARRPLGRTLARLRATGAQSQ